MGAGSEPGGQRKFGKQISDPAFPSNSSAGCTGAAPLRDGFGPRLFSAEGLAVTIKHVTPLITARDCGVSRGDSSDFSSWSTSTN